MRNVSVRRVLKSFPHIHHREPNMLCFLGSKPCIESVHTLFRTVAATKPNGAVAFQVTHHNPVRVSFTDRQLINADDLRMWLGSATQLLAHVLLIQLLDCLPIQMQFLGNIGDRRGSAAFADIQSKALRVERIVRQKVEPFLSHFLASATLDAAQFDLKIHPRVTAGKITNTASLAVVKTRRRTTTQRADSFF